MAKKRIHILDCEICKKPGADRVSCGWCKEREMRVNEDAKPKHLLCMDCFMRGCPVLYLLGTKVI
jgi:hypothetical protein